MSGSLNGSHEGWEYEDYEGGTPGTTSTGSAGQWIGMIMLLFALWGCRKEVTAPVARQEPEGRTVELHAVAAAADVRTVMESGGAVKWEVGDSIWVRYKTSDTGGTATFGHSVFKAVEIEDGGAAARFVGQLPAGNIDGNIWAGSPAGSFCNSYPCTDASTAVCLPAEQNLQGRNIDTEAIVALAKAQSINDDFVFYNVCGGIAFTLTDPEIDEVSIYGYGIGCPHIVSMKDGVPSSEIPSDLGDGYGCVTLDTRGHSAGDLLHCPLFPGTTSHLFITFTKGGVAATRDFEGPVTIKRSTFLRMTDVDEGLQYRAKPAAFKELVGEGGESANCYVVQRNQSYCFPIFKGNSSEKLTDVAFTSLLWESGTEEGKVITHHYTLGDYVYFATGNAPSGNAVIAVTDMFNEILWSWHIWMPGNNYEPDAYAQSYPNNAGVMMDRNLGATSAAKGTPESFGMMYQWGRKDPFPGAAGLTGTETAPTTATWPEAVESSSTTGTSEYAVQHPMTFIMNSTGLNGGHNTAGDWFYSSTQGNMENNRWNSVKGLYDPCPPGWQVPGGGPSGVWATAAGKQSEMSGAAALWDSQNYGYNFTSWASPLCWYPAAGTRVGNSIGSNGQVAACWGSEPSTNDNACVLMGMYDYAVLYSSTFERYYALPVRCCRSGSENGGANYIDLGKDGTANCYVVTRGGLYEFKAVKGNDQNSVIAGIASVDVLWETFGSATAPTEGDIISSVSLNGDYIRFSATGREGNAVIEAKDASGNILWSWHIWSCQGFKEEYFYHSAGTTMDRNLGALTTDRGTPRANGLFYQWGRKDPFPGSATLTGTTPAATTVSWPAPVECNASTGTVDYSIAHPTTHIKNNSLNYDWCYTGGSSSDATRWSGTDKTIYDPCPPGWMVPAGGPDGVWAIASGERDNYTDNQMWHYGSAQYCYTPNFTSGTCIYPAAGIVESAGNLYLEDLQCCQWSGTHKEGTSMAYGLRLQPNGLVTFNGVFGKANGRNVRCVKEDGTRIVPVTSLEFAEPAMKVLKGDVCKLSVNIYPSNATSKNLTFQVSDTQLMYVDSENNLHVGNTAGTCTVTATSNNGKTATCTVTVKQDIVFDDGVPDANCYVCPEKGRYAFRPDRGMVAGTPYADIGVVDVLWQSYCDSRTATNGCIIRDVKLEGNRIYFKTTGEAGNAVIFMTMKNAPSKVVWSWHIWCTGGATLESMTRVVNGITIMDRNLGALSNDETTASYGLWYQWGRKDPFFIRDNPSYVKSRNSQYSPYFGFKPPYDSRGYAMDYYVERPWEYDAVQKWYYNSNVADRLDLWPHDSKSKYDPCPQGWMVPNYDELEAATPSDQSGTVKSNGILYNGVWYPTAGFFWEMGGDTTEGLYWMSGYGSLQGKQKVRVICPDGNAIASYNEYNGRTSYIWDILDGSMASVRCVKEKRQ